jgi:hypothetical protein
MAVCFPSLESVNRPASGVERRHHLDPSVLQKAVRHAICDAAMQTFETQRGKR